MCWFTAMKNSLFLFFCALLVGCAEPVVPPVVSFKTNSVEPAPRPVTPPQPAPPTDDRAPTVVPETGSRRLGYWRFNRGTVWSGENGQLPVEALNLTNVPSFDGGALLMNNPKGISLLKFRAVETNGQVNLDIRNGSVRLMYKPYWNSVGVGMTGRGPGQWARLISLGTPTTPPTGWFDLAIDPLGKNLYFQCQNAAGSNGWSAPILFYSS